MKKELDDKQVKYQLNPTICNVGISKVQVLRRNMIILQKSIMQLYATLGETHQKMHAVGQRTSLPPADELRIMNVANLTPDQLLQLCANARDTSEKQVLEGYNSFNTSYTYLPDAIAEGAGYEPGTRFNPK